MHEKLLIFVKNGAMIQNFIMVLIVPSTKHLAHMWEKIRIHRIGKT